MSHPFGDLLTQYLHRKHGLSQSKLAAGILQPPSIISEMSQGKRLNGPQARERVTAIIGWLQQQGALAGLDDANALLNAAGMSPLQGRAPDEAHLIHTLSAQAVRQQSLELVTQRPQSTSSALLPRHNLLAQLTPFIGRAEQIAFLEQHVQIHRLFILTGAGGVGKTRLALEVATRLLAEFADGVWFVDLAPLTDPEAIPQRILDLWRVPEQSESTPLAALIRYLGAKEALLILDNCEHLIGACAALAETLLQHCLQLSLLATSREALNIRGETTTLQPLWVQSLVRLGACEVMLTDISRGEQHLHNVLLFATDRERALALLYLGFAASDRGDLTLAHTNLQESFAISQRCNDKAGMADALHRLAEGSSDQPEACRPCAESLALWRQVGRPDRIARAINYLGWNIWCVGDYPLAREYWREGLAFCDQLDMPLEKAWLLDCIGTDAWIDDLTFAEQCIREALAIYTELGHQRGIAFCKADLAWALANMGQVEQAIVLTQEAVAITRAVNSQMMLTMSLNYLGAALSATDDWAAARSALSEAIQRAWQHRYLYNLMNAFYYVAELLVLEGNALALPDALERQALAVTALCFVRTQPATWKFFKDKAAQLQAEIEVALPGELRAAAIARCQTCTLGEMVVTALDTMAVG